MPRNGSGQYNPLTNTWNPPVTGVLATGTDFQAQLNDISAAITQSVSKDGQTPMTANLPMNNNSIVGLATGTAASPSISPINDTNTGLYFPAADTVGVAVGGVQALLIDSAGIEVPAGTAAAPSLTTTGDTNTGLYFPAADTVAIATGGVKRVEVDASGNFGLGVTPSNKLDVDLSAGLSQTFSTISADPGIGNLGSGIRFGWGSSVNGPSIRVLHGGDYNNAGIGFSVWSGATNVRAMTLDASANLLVGTTSAGSQGQRLATDKSGGGNYFAFGSNNTNAFVVYNSGNTGVYLVNGQTSWTANSDERLKDIIEPITNAVAKVSTLRTVIGKYKTDAEGTRRAFLIAQDVQAVLPEAVNTQADEHGTLGVQYTDTIPLLTAAIKEQQALIEAQKTAIESLTDRIAALETISWYLQTTR